MRTSRPLVSASALDTSFCDSYVVVWLPAPPGGVGGRARSHQLLWRGADSDTLFGKIARKEIPSKVVFEDDRVLAFRDIAPVARVHIVIVPKVRGRLANLALAEEADEAILGHLMRVAGIVAKAEGLDRGFRVVVNNGPHARAWRGPRRVLGSPHAWGVRVQCRASTTFTCT